MSRIQKRHTIEREWICGLFTYKLTILIRDYGTKKTVDVYLKRWRGIARSGERCVQLHHQIPYKRLKGSAIFLIFWGCLKHLNSSDGFCRGIRLVQGQDMVINKGFSIERLNVAAFISGRPLKEVCMK